MGVYDLLSIFSCVIVVAMNITLFGGAAVVKRERISFELDLLSYELTCRVRASHWSD